VTFGKKISQNSDYTSRGTEKSKGTSKGTQQFHSMTVEQQGIIKEDRPDRLHHARASTVSIMIHPG
jgi:uncharacterized membrane protein